MISKRFQLFFVTAVLAMILPGTAGLSFAEKPTVLTPCKQCHQPEKDMVMGTLVSVSEKFRTINVQVGQKLVWIINYGEDLKIIGADKLLSIARDKEIGIRFTGDEKKPYAVSLTVKPPAKVALEKLVSVEEMTKLVAMDPEKGRYVIVDSRPKPRFNEGHIPHAVSLDNAKFDEQKEKVLPKDKDILLIFYCGGVT